MFVNKIFVHLNIFVTFEFFNKIFVTFVTLNIFVTLTEILMKIILMMMNGVEVVHEVGVDTVKVLVNVVVTTVQQAPNLKVLDSQHVVIIIIM